MQRCGLETNDQNGAPGPDLYDGATRVIVPVPTRSTVRRFAWLQKTGSRLLVISLPYAPC